MFTNKGFTLIELLVVVLIIGILAAIAVPQYQKAVEKSELSEALIQARAIIQAQKEYELANGSFATDLNLLSLDFPDNKWACNNTWCIYFGKPKLALLEILNIDNNYHAIQCIAKNERQQEQCLSIGGQYFYTHKNGAIYYYINRKL